MVIRVRDGYGGLDLQRFQIDIERPNSSPIFLATPDARLVAELPHRYQVQAQDAENDDLAYGLVSAPEQATIDETTGVIRWTPALADVGQHEIRVSVDDGNGNVVTRDILFEVVATAPNNPPIFDPFPAVLSPRRDRDYQYQLTANDPDGDPLTFQRVDGPSGLTVSDSGLLEWHPPADDAGEHPVSVRVVDGRGGIALAEFLLVSVPVETNGQPQILNPPPETAVANQIYGHDFVGYDPDGDAILWQLVSGPAGMSLDPYRGTLRWLPHSDQVGDHAFRVAAMDGQSQFGINIYPYQVTVRAANTAPLITSVPPTQASIDTAFRYEVAASDIDGDPLEFTVSGPNGISIDPTAGVLEWTPGAAQTGTHRVGITVSDGIASASQWFDLIVDAASPNGRPEITSIPGFHATVSEEYQYNVQAEDPEGQAVTYQLVSSPLGMQITPTGRITWTPTALGPVDVVVSASDPAGQGVSQAYTLDVLATNNDPTIDSAANESVAAGGIYRSDVRATDVDGDPLTFSLIGAPEGMTVDSQRGQIRWSPQAELSGSYPFTVEVSDGRGGIATQAVNLAVGPDQSPPQIEIVIDQNPIDVGGTVTIVVNAVDDVAVVTKSLSVGGEIIPLDSTGRATLSADVIGVTPVTAIATDPTGNEGQASVDLLVTDPSDVDAPEVSIQSPGYGDTITGPIDVIGTVTDASLLSYTLSYAPLSGGEFVPFSGGSIPVIDGLLGQFDPTLLANDTYIIQLEAIDIDGKTSVEQILVDVTGDLKVGNFTVSFNDLSIPVSGIPITLARTYDSFNAQHADDFGYGWRMEFRDIDLRSSVASTGAEEDLIYNPFYDWRTRLRHATGRKPPRVYLPPNAGTGDRRSDRGDF